MINTSHQNSGSFTDYLCGRALHKVPLLTCKTIQNTSPSYLTELVSPYNLRRNLRAISNFFLCQPRTKLLRYGGTSFLSVALALWNQLPDSLRAASSVGVVKRNLTTHRFSQAYYSQLKCNAFRSYDTSFLSGLL